MKETGIVVDAGIDYLSMTMKRDNPNLQPWIRASQSYLAEIAVLSEEIKISKRLGYEGASFGGSFVGERDRDALVVFSGSRAKRAFTLLYRPDVHVSRIDVQTSFQYSHTTNNVAEIVRNEVKRDNVKIGAARQRNATLMEDLRGGATCYVGTRTSEQFARIYNKEAESGDTNYERVWRFEVQLKNRYAGKLAEQFSRQAEDETSRALTFVKHWLRHRGVSVPWQADAELYPLPTIASKETQLEEKLKWLRTQVRPSLRVLLKYGLRDAILEALGLDEPSI